MVDTTDIKEVVVTPETPLDPSPKRVEGHEIGETVSADLGSVAGTLHKPPLKIETEDKGQETVEDVTKSPEERPQKFGNVLLDNLKVRGLVKIKDKNALVDRFGNPVIPQSGGEDGAEVNIIAYNVTMADDEASLTVTAEQWAKMQDTSEECIVVIQYGSGAKVELARTKVNSSEVVFTGIHRYQDGFEIGTARITKVNSTISGSYTYEYKEYANISGQAFTGAITSPSIIEDMGSDYGIELLAESVYFQTNYAGAVKNGNKLTLVLAGTFTRTAETPANIAPCYFLIPKNVADKLFSNSLGALDNKQVLFMDSTTSGVSKFARIIKASSVTPDIARLLVTFYGVNSLTIGTPYEFRYEVTFLLSDNLAS